MSLADETVARATPAVPTTMAEFRARFPATRRWTYLNTSSAGIMSRAACDAANAVNEAIAAGDFTKEAWGWQLASARARFAALVGARAHEIAVVKNVSEGLNAAATAVPARPGDNVVVCEALEHPNNVYLWRRMAAEGVEIRAVAARDGAIDAAAMAQAVDARTRIVTVSSVTFTPGFRTDLARIGRTARAHGAFFLVDAVQSCGIIHHDVEAEFIDALVTSTTKNLLGTTGLGFLYVSDRWVERLAPVYVSRFSVARGSGHESEVEDGFSYAPDARRFENGNYNWPGLAAADVALAEIAGLGVPRIERHAVALADALRDGLARLGLPVNRPVDAALRTPMVTVGMRGAGGAYEAADPRLNRLAEALAEARVKFSIRLGLVRFGFHAFNDETDVAHVLDVARSALP